MQLRLIFVVFVVFLFSTEHYFYLESSRSSQGERGRSVQPLHPSTSTTYLVSFIILNAFRQVDRLVGKHLMVGKNIPNYEISNGLDF